MNRLILLSLLLSGCASVPRATSGGKVLDFWEKVSDKAYIRVRGIGATRPEARGLTARRGASRDAALVAARYQLLSVIKGVKLEGGVTMAQLMERDSLIREIADEVVSGGEEVLVEWLHDDGAVVTLELRRSKVERLINEKSKREKDLEQRVARSIEEIKRLNGALDIALMSPGAERKWGEVRERAVKVKRLADDVNRLETMLDAAEKTQTSAYDGVILEQVIDTSSRLAEEEKANCWFPISACYWGHGRFSGKWSTSEK